MIAKKKTDGLVIRRDYINKVDSTNNTQFHYVVQFYFIIRVFIIPRFF